MPLRFAPLVRKVVIRAMGVVAIAMPLSACALLEEDDTYQQSVTDPADLVYNQGLMAVRAGEYSKALRRFESLERQNPGTEWARKGLLLSAYSAYTGGLYDDAMRYSQRYVATYGDTKDAAYAAYLYANANYAQIPDITRDQEKTRKALAAFQELVKRWPTSEYVEDAKFKIQVTRDQLAGKEMAVGRFYLEQRNYPAAINRFKFVITEFQQTRHVEESLSRLTEAYMALGITSEAQTAAAILGNNYPDSPWYKDAYTLVKSGGLEPREDQESWMSKTFRKMITL